MTEVKRGNGASSLSLKKPPSFSNTSSSYKHMYDDVFASPHHSRQQSSAFMDDDYAEMFGSSKSDNGAWSIPYSSIPVLDLPPPSEMRVRGVSGVTSISGESRVGEVDYEGVFGGVGTVSFGLTNGEELFDQFKKKARTSSSYIIPKRSNGQAEKTVRSEILGQPQISPSPIDGVYQSFDSMERHEQKNNQVASKSSDEPAKAVTASDMPKFTYSNGLTSPPRKTLVGNQPGTKDACYETRQSGEAPTNGQSLSGANHIEYVNNNVSNSTKKDASCATDVPSAELCADMLHESGPNQQNLSCVPPVIKVDTLHKVDPNQLNLSSKTSEIKSDTVPVDVDLVGKQRSHCRSASIDLCASKQSSEPFNDFQNVCRSGPVAVDVPQLKDVDLIERQGSHGSSTVMDLSATKQSSEHLTGFHKASKIGSISVDVPQDTCQVDPEEGPSYTVSDVDAGRKKARHSKMTSLDIGHDNHSHELDGRFHRKFRIGGSYSFDSSHDPCAARIKLQPSVTAPSPSLPQFFPVESRYKISENSSYRGFETNFHIGAGGSPPSLNEQLHMNSDAAVSAAALKSAMEEAAEIIRLANEYLDRKSQGSTRLRFKDTLKVIPGKNEQEADEMNELLQTMLHKRTLTTGSEKDNCATSKRTGLLVSDQGSPVYEDQKKSIKDEPVFKLHKKFDHDDELLGNAQTVQVSEDQEKIWKEEHVIEYQKKFVQDEDKIDKRESSVFEEKNKFVKDELVFVHRREIVGDGERVEGNNDNISKIIDESDRREGGLEWEAAKHLNQLISGVKNKFASFMAWQTETEKKEDLKETEQSTEFQPQAEESDPNFKEVEKFEMQGADKNQDAADCAGDTVHVELEVGFVSDTVEQNDHESFRGRTLEREQVESELHTNQVVARLASENLILFSNRNDRVFDSIDSIEEAGNVYQEIDVDVKSVREQLLDETEIEHLQNQGDEKGREGFDDKTMTGNSDIQDDEHSHESPNIEEVDEIMEESSDFLDGQSSKDPTFEEGHSRKLDEESGDELMHHSHFSEGTADTTEEQVEHEECEVVKEVEDCQYNVQFMNKPDPGEDMVKNPKATETRHVCEEIEMDQSQINDFEDAADNTIVWDDSAVNECLETDHIKTTGDEFAEKTSFFDATDNECKQTQSGCVEATNEVPVETNYVLAAEDDCRQAEIEYEHLKKVSEQAEIESEHLEKVNEQPHEQSTCFAAVEDECQTENASLSQGGAASRNDVSCPNVEDKVSPDEENARMWEIPNLFTKAVLKKEDLLSAQKASELIGDETLLPSKNSAESDGAEEHLKINETLQYENFVVPNNENDVCFEKEEIDIRTMDSECQDISENGTSLKHDSGETQRRGELEEYDQNVGHFGVEAMPKRRRWFDSAIKVGPVEKPRILEEGRVYMETDQEFLDDSDLSGSVEIHVDKLCNDTENAIAGQHAAAALNMGSGRVDVEATPRRRRWFVKTGEEGLPDPPPLFQGMKVTSEEPQKMVNEVLRPSVSDGNLDKLNAKYGESLNVPDADVTINGETDKKSVEANPRRKRWFESGENVGSASHLRINDDSGATLQTEQVSKGKGAIQTSKQVKDDGPSKVEPVNEQQSPLTEVNRREKEKEKEKIAVERVIREARERAFAEARERARRDVVEKPNVEARQRVGFQERLGKVSTDACLSSDKASMEAKVRTERAAVERATVEARERALQKALSEKDIHKSKEQAGKSVPNFQCSSSSSRPDLSNKGGKTDGLDSESAQSIAQLERQSRTMERAAKALEEKNRRDLLAQKEQAARNMLADSLDAEVKRWSTGKEGNLRVLLSTLQYVLGPDSGWQTISLTDLVSATAVRKAYKKATLCVHPDKLQQRGATIQQKYICEKVFELLKQAWSKFSPDER